MRPTANLNAHELSVNITGCDAGYVLSPSLFCGSISNLSCVQKTQAYSRVVPHRWRFFPLAGAGAASVLELLVPLTGPATGAKTEGAEVVLALPVAAALDAATFSARFAFTSARF